MTTVEELQGIVAGLTAIVKQQAEAQKATNTQIANLTEALLAHGGPPTAPATAQVNSTPLRMPALQLPQFRYDQNTHDDVNEFLESFDVQTTHLQAATKLTLLQQACVGEWPNSVLSMEKTKFTDETTPLQKLDSFKQALKSTFAEPPEVQRRRLALQNRSIASHFASKTTFIASLNWANPWTETRLSSSCRSLSPKRNQTFKNIWCLKQKNTKIFLRSSKPQNESSVHSALRTVNPINNRRNKLTLLPLIQLLVFLVVAAKDLAVIVPMAIPKATAPKKRRKTTILRIPKEVTKFAVYGTNINDLPAFYQTNHVDMAVFTTVTLVPSQVARILIMQTLVHLLQTPAKFNHHRQPNWDHALLNHLSLVFSLSLPTLRYF